MTIELGFANMKLSDQTTISIVDVPGHEKFIKTMVAGASGIDIALLIIAADEGIMPQTKEHLNIIKAFKISSLIVVITKVDLVDNEWLDMIKLDTNEFLEENEYKEVPIIEVSSNTEQGIENLKKEIEVGIKKVDQKLVTDLFRLPIDRVFTLKGYGTVVTGTVLGGNIKKGDLVEILPKGLKVKVKELHVHGQSQLEVTQGQRCALNLTDVTKDEINRGDLLSFPNILTKSRLVDAVVENFDKEKPINHNQRVHVHVGTKEVLARLRIIGNEEILPGEKGYVQLRFEESTIAIRGDNFIIRAYSPVTTIGGGTVIYHNVSNRPRFKNETLEVFKIEEQGTLKEIIYYILNKEKSIKSIEKIWKTLFVNKEQIEIILNEEVIKKGIIKLETENLYISRENYDYLVTVLETMFENYFIKYPYRYYVKKEEIRNKIFNNFDDKAFNELLGIIAINSNISIKNDIITTNEQIVITKVRAKQEVIIIENNILKAEGYVSKKSQLVDIYKTKPDMVEEIINFLINTKVIIEITEHVYIHMNIFDDIVENIQQLLNDNAKISIQLVKEKIGASRKLTICLLEYLDELKITQRVGNERSKYRK